MNGNKFNIPVSNKGYYFISDNCISHDHDMTNFSNFYCRIKIKHRLIYFGIALNKELK